MCENIKIERRYVRFLANRMRPGIRSGEIRSNRSNAVTRVAADSNNPCEAKAVFLYNRTPAQIDFVEFSRKFGVVLSIVDTLDRALPDRFAQLRQQRFLYYRPPATLLQISTLSILLIIYLFIVENRLSN